jgi:hypothetical protein
VEPILTIALLYGVRIEPDNLEMFPWGYYQPCLNLFQYIHNKGLGQELSDMYFELGAALEAYNPNQVFSKNDEVENVLCTIYAGALAMKEPLDKAIRKELIRPRLHLMLDKLVDRFKQGLVKQHDARVMQLLMGDLIDFRVDEVQDIGWVGDDASALLATTVALASQLETPDGEGWFGSQSHGQGAGTIAGNAGVDEAATGMGEMAIDDQL